MLYGTLRTLRDDAQATLVAASSASPSTPPLRMNAKRFTSTNPATPTPPTSAAEAALMAQVMAEGGRPREAPTPNIDPAMTSEDFGFMLQQVPGAYGWIGNGKNGQRGTSLHHPGYDFRRRQHRPGRTLWDTLARRWLEQSSA